MGPDDVNGIRELGRKVESLGYDELYSSDHLGLFDPFVPLVVAAEATSSLRVGPLVLNNEFHNPALLARTAASVDRLSGGRLIVGLGAGYAQAEHDAIGLPLRPPGARVTRFEESVQVLRSLLDSGSAELAGSEIDVAVGDLGVRPVQERVPILIGGHGRRMVGVAGRHADVFQFTGMSADGAGGLSPSGFAFEELVERRGWLVEAAGDRFDDLELSALVQRTAIGADHESVRADLAARFGFEARLIAECPFLLLGSVEQVIDKLERLRERLGISHYVVRDADGFAPVVEALAGR